MIDDVKWMYKKKKKDIVILWSKIKIGMEVFVFNGVFYIIVNV